MTLRAWAIVLVHRVVDRALGVDGQAVINPSPGGGPDIIQGLPVLQRFVRHGGVDYQALRGAPEYHRFCACAAALHRAQPPGEEGAARAWWINLYNALVMHAVVTFGIRRSVWEDRGFFRRAAYRVGGFRMSADDIEHGILRGNRRHPILPVRQFAPGDPRLRWALPLDPRVHFALACASRSCPVVRVYTADHLDAQLDAAADAFINGGGVDLDPRSGEVRLSQIFRWYRSDFGGSDGTIGFVLRYLRDPGARRALQRATAVRYLRYDWTLNTVMADS